MSVKLVILGILKDRPLHGYECKAIIEEHMGDWTNIAFGSIYFALGKLADEHLIEKITEEQEGKRPARSVYQITDKGRKEFLSLLRSTWSSRKRDFYDLDLALFFANQLPRKEVVEHIGKRIRMVRKVLKHLKSHKEEELRHPEVPARAEGIFMHSYYHLRAEYTWLKQLQRKYEEGVY